jgi:hypothetical protein
MRSRSLTQVQISQRTLALRRAAELPVDGPLLAIEDLMADLGCSRRQIEMLFELGEIACFKDGKHRVTTPAIRDDYVRRRIAEEIQRLEDMGK